MKHQNSLTVEVNVAALIEDVQYHLAKHQAIVAEARRGFEAAAHQALQQHLADLANGKLNGLTIHLRPVDDHSKDYERIIGMLKMHVGQTITLGADDYACYVQDDWEWKETWQTINSQYLR